MKIVFLSSCFSHHQKPLSEALMERSDFAYVEVLPLTEAYRSLGWGTGETPSYVHRMAEDPAGCEQLILDADILIYGAAPQALLKPRIRAGKPILRYSERPLKKGLEPTKYLPRLLRWHRWNPPGKPIYMLCASAYTAGDYARFGLFRGRAYKFGYFPECRRYPSLPDLMQGKDRREILWCGRFLDCKHPDDAIEALRRLRAEGSDCHLTMIGSGEMESVLREKIRACGLEDVVTLIGSMSPEVVRDRMEKAGIFLATSDRREGWGVVLNEAMNSGCAVVASRDAGSTLYLVRDGENGLTYHAEDVDGLCRAIRRLLCEPETQVRLGEAAYRTISEEWNAEVAAERLLTLGECILRGERKPRPFETGVFSPATAQDTRCE